MKKVLTGLIVISLIAIGTIKLSSAFFSDTETSKDNVLAAGALDLKIDNQSYYNGVFNPNTSWDSKDLDKNTLFFNFPDLKPSDWGEDTISLTVHDNEAWACVDINLTSNDDVTCTEPEKLVDPTCNEPNDNLFDGELAQNVNMIFWADDGDNVLEDNEMNSIIASGSAEKVLTDAKWVLADSTKNNVGGQLGDGLKGLQTYYVGKAWCFGTLTPNPVPQGQGVNPTVNSGILCDGSNLDNSTQTDKLTGDITFRAYQHRNNPDFVCNEPECHQEVFGDTAVLADTHQGTLKNGNPITDPNRTNPANATGAPDWVPGTGTNFFSLGKGGFITLKFVNPVKDGAGDDLSFHEATNGRDSYPEEKAEVFVSQDGITFKSIGFVTSEPGGGGDGVVLLDISSSGYTDIQYVKLVDATNYEPHIDTADGYDLDAIDGVYGQCTI